jgi:hypothetical protein
MTQAAAFRLTVALAVVALLAVPSALATIQRTFVSANGNDTNPCTNALPCRSFGHAIGQTNAGGEIVVLDSAGYGRVTINKSVTIVAPPGVYAGISVFPGTNGVDIATPGIDVVLRGLTINGQGGITGVMFLDGNSLVVEDCLIADMSSTGLSLTAPNSNVTIRNTVVRNNSNLGVRVASGDVLDARIDRVTIEGSQFGLEVSTGARAHVRDSTIARNSMGGVSVVPGVISPGTATFAQLTMARTSVVANGTFGVAVHGISDKEAVASIADCEISGNGIDGISVLATTSNTATVALSSSRVHNNGHDGVIFDNSSGTIRADLVSNTITRNATLGVRITGGAVVFSNAANLVKHNVGGDVSGTVTAAPI